LLFAQVTNHPNFQYTLDKPTLLIPQDQESTTG